MAYVRDLWLMDGQFYTKSEKLLRICDYHNKFTVNPLPGHVNVFDWMQKIPPSNRWDAGNVSIIQYRVHPGAYAHEVKDTLARNFFHLVRFIFNENFDLVDLTSLSESSSIRELYLDGVQVNHNITRTLSNFAPVSRQLHELPNMFFSEAILGHEPFAHHCPTGDAYGLFADFLAARVLNTESRHAQDTNGCTVWFVNRNHGASREILNHDEVVLGLKKALERNQSRKCRLLDERPGTISFYDQIRLAQMTDVLVGPHGANLGAAILGHIPNVIEIQNPEYQSAWWGEMVWSMERRWFTTQTNTQPEGSAKSRVDVPKLVDLVLQVLQKTQNYKCKYDCDTMMKRNTNECF